MIFAVGSSAGLKRDSVSAGCKPETQLLSLDLLAFLFEEY